MCLSAYSYSFSNISHITAFLKTDKFTSKSTSKNNDRISFSVENVDVEDEDEDEDD